MFLVKIVPQAISDLCVVGFELICGYRCVTGRYPITMSQIIVKNLVRSIEMYCANVGLDSARGSFLPYMTGQLNDSHRINSQME